jgi:lipoprotein-anchoring transpeptidase ErfK/SrfK
MHHRMIFSVFVMLLMVFAGCTADPVSIGSGDPYVWEGEAGLTKPLPTPPVFESPIPAPAVAISVSEPLTVAEEADLAPEASVPSPPVVDVEEDVLSLRTVFSDTATIGVCVGGEGKRIIVVLSEQKLYACEGERLVLETPVSTGTAYHPTPVGEYQIYLKLTADRMTGPGYNLPAVPWTMYFYRGYAVHGAYWHDQFGRVMSHGCINLPTMECPSGWTCPAQGYANGRDIAKELFEWAEPILSEGASYVYSSADNPGTLVIVRP